MKITIALLLACLLTACSGNHQWMEKAQVAQVEGKTLVVFPAGERNGVSFWKPQFSTECPYNKIYQSDNTSTNCRIRESRITSMVPYGQHMKSTKVIQRPVTVFMEDMNSTVHIPDDI